MSYDVGLCCFESLMSYDLGLCCFESLMSYDLGLCCFTRAAECATHCRRPELSRDD